MRDCSHQAQSHVPPLGPWHILPGIFHLPQLVISKANQPRQKGADDGEYLSDCYRE